MYGNPAFIAQFGDRCLGMPAREALIDLLAYKASYEVSLADQRAPVGLGVAWGSGLLPVDRRVMLATVDNLDLGLSQFLAQPARSMR